MRELERSIPKIQISKRYSDFVSEFVRELTSRLSENLHSIYICGSIAKGKALYNESDADFTVVFKNDINPNDISTIEIAKTILLQHHPYITKIDAPTCTTTDVISNIEGWGFWIKIVSACIFGNDLSNDVPPIYPTESLIGILNKDLLANIERLYKVFSSSDSDNCQAGVKRLSKKIIMASYNLIMEKVGFWTDDILICYRNLIKQFPNKKGMFEKLYMQSRKPYKDRKKVLEILDNARKWYGARITCR